MSTINTDNYTLGMCSLYYTASVAHSDLLTATFRSSANSLGNIVTAEISPDVSYVEHYMADQGKRKKDKVALNLVNVTIPFTFDEMNTANIKRFFMASTLNTNQLAPFEKPLAEGSVQLYFDTSVGQDMVYYIPKCTIRPDGAISMNPEDWWAAPMVIDVLYYDTGHWASKPYGKIDKSATAIS